MSQNNPAREYDVVIIGSGAAGLTTALHLADIAKIAIISKSDLPESSTFYAQGGIAAVLDDEDSIQSHVNDTMVAGAGLCDEQAVNFTVSHSKEAIDWLIHQGVEFSRNSTDNQYHLTREGGHSHRRIIHSADTTGEAVQTNLVGAARQNKNITLYERYNAIDLITAKKFAGSENNFCYGLYALNRETHEVETFKCRFLVLATG
ncbi:MAG: FAD-dependent oxidoreductase, partial [Gammaproteobacteria bacterium]|nr:FAD-dependent oxidoreductase [Gammaproteobacteria bacterium]